MLLLAQRAMGKDPSMRDMRDFSVSAGVPGPAGWDSQGPPRYAGFLARMFETRALYLSIALVAIITFTWP